MDVSAELATLIATVLLWLLREALGLRQKKNAAASSPSSHTSADDSGTFSIPLPATKSDVERAQASATDALLRIARHEERCEERWGEVVAMLARLDERSRS